MKDLNKVMTALITPFSGGRVDFASLEKLVAQQVAEGIEGFVVNGTTAESPTLSDEEVAEIFKTVRSTAKEAVLILGTGSNSTSKTIESTRRARDFGADAALVVVPYYNKPTQKGMYEHFKAVAKESGAPILLYNVPSRTGVSLTAETIEALADEDGIVGIKEASGDMALARRIREACGSHFVLLSGDDGTYESFLEAGGRGIISVASHVIPRAFVESTNRHREGKNGSGEKPLAKYAKLIESLYVESNPIPVKKALQLMGMIHSAEMRLPLTELPEDKTEIVARELRAAGVLK